MASGNKATPSSPTGCLLPHNRGYSSAGFQNVPFAFRAIEAYIMACVCTLTLPSKTQQQSQSVVIELGGGWEDPATRGPHESKHNAHIP